MTQQDPISLRRALTSVLPPAALDFPPFVN